MPIPISIAKIKGIVNMTDKPRLTHVLRKWGMRFNSLIKTCGVGARWYHQGKLGGYYKQKK